MPRASQGILRRVSTPHTSLIRRASKKNQQTRRADGYRTLMNAEPSTAAESSAVVGSTAQRKLQVTFRRLRPGKRNLRLRIPLEFPRTKNPMGRLRCSILTSAPKSLMPHAANTCVAAPPS